MMAELDGLELCRILRARPALASLRIIMVSARADNVWRANARSAGVDGYVTKPLDVRYLENSVRFNLAAASH